MAALLAACALRPPPAPAPLPPAEPGLPPAGPVADTAPLGPPIERARSRWVPVRWAELPGFEQDDTAAAWNAWMLDGVKPAGAECDTAALQRNVAFGRKYNITGTPTLIFTDGTRAPGAIPTAQVEKMLSAAN